MEERIHSIKIFKEDKVIADGSVKIDDFFNTTIKDLVKNVRSGDAEKEERIPPFLFCLPDPGPAVPAPFRVFYSFPPAGSVCPLPHRDVRMAKISVREAFFLSGGGSPCRKSGILFVPES